MELTFTWKTVRIAAGKVSKLVVGVSSSKLNLWGNNKQNVIKLQRHKKSHLLLQLPEDGAAFCPLH